MLVFFILISFLVKFWSAVLFKPDLNENMLKKAHRMKMIVISRDNLSKLHVLIG